jgi:hypothetical protein
MVCVYQNITHVPSVGKIHSMNRKQLFWMQCMKIIKWLIAGYGLLGELFAHVVFPIKTQLPNCEIGSFIRQAYCQTGIPAIGVNPWLAYHVSVHFVLGFAVILLITPNRIKRIIHID